MALVDADYKFITIDVGSYGKNSDGTVFRDSQLDKSLLTNQLDYSTSKITICLEYHTTSCDYCR